LIRCKSRDDETPGFETEFDFVVVCNGVFHRPNIPEVSGLDQFTGKILHSSEVKDSVYGKNDKVAVVGGGKSAYDCATYAANQSLNPTLVFRRSQWMAPRYLPGGRIPGDWLVTSRFMALFLRYHRAGTGGRMLHSVGKPLVWLWWKLIGLGWRKDLQIPPGMIPEDKLPSGIEKIGVGGDFYAVVNAGKARAVCGSLSRFTENGIELTDGTVLPADVVVFATGWHQTISFLSKELQSEIAGEGYIRLFRTLLPPTAPNLGFIGYASSVACQLTAEIGAHWLSEHFLGSLALPSVEQMNQEIDQVHAWAEEHLPMRGTEGFIGPYLSPYVDELMRDMRLPTRRERKFRTEYFGPFRASRYAGLTEERRAARVAK
jgi:dimethylaniline monooxygenase (N-oxide forming)